MITEIAAATAQLIQLIDDILRQTSTRELAAATQRATNDVQSFKDDLLGRRRDNLNLRLAGLQHGILVRLTDAEHHQLNAFSPELSALDLLGLYARARAADLAAESGQILSAHAAAGSGSSTPGLI